MGLNRRIARYDEDKVMNEEEGLRLKFKKYIIELERQISNEPYHVVWWNVDACSKTIYIRVDLSQEPKDRYFIHQIFVELEKEAWKKERKELFFYVGSLPKD